MYFILSWDFTVSGSVTESDCLCGLWALSWNHVARNIQQSIRSFAKRWNRYVCITGIRWRYGLCRRSYPGWNDFRFFGRQPENGHSGRNYLSGTAASWNSPLQKRKLPFIMLHAKKACRDINPDRLSLHFFFLYKKLRSGQKTFIYSSRLSFIFPSIPDFFNGSVIMIAMIVPPQVLMRNGTTNINNVAAVFPITRYATG